MQQRQPAIGDVRGRGLLIGIDLVYDRTTRAPAEDLAQRVPSPHLWKSARDQAHFVLVPYAAAAGGSEATAAKALLKQLDELGK